jgi:hypothetical protein
VTPGHEIRKIYSSGVGSALSSGFVPVVIGDVLRAQYFVSDLTAFPE